MIVGFVIPISATALSLWFILWLLDGVIEGAREIRRDRQLDQMREQEHRVSYIEFCAQQAVEDALGDEVYWRNLKPTPPHLMPQPVHDDV